MDAMLDSRAISGRQTQVVGVPPKLELVGSVRAV